MGMGEGSIPLRAETWMPSTTGRQPKAVRASFQVVVLVLMNSPLTSKRYSCRDRPAEERQRVGGEGNAR